MKLIIRFAISITLIMLTCFYCTQKRPTMPDAVGNLTVVAIDTSGTYNIEDDSKLTPVPGATVHMNSKEYTKKETYQTGEDGKIELNGVLASRYEVNIVYSLDNHRNLVGGNVLNVYSDEMLVDTVKLALQTLAPVIINEIYYCGPKSAYNYFYDQYVELYNHTDTTVYLDGMIIGRMRCNPDERPLKETVSNLVLTYAFKFAGKPGEKNVPLGPKEYAVIATDAYDHSKACAEAVNLENADYEFCNQTGHDYDNPDVPNLDNINTGRTTDFMISVLSDVIIMTSGESYELIDIDDSPYISVPISTVVDGVEYKSGTSLEKYLTVRVDAGYAGVGITRKCGMSVQRINPSHDTNNSTVDFHNLDSPTPGY